VLRLTILSLLDQILDGDVKIGEHAVESREHLPHCFRPCRFKGQWRADQRIWVDKLVQSPT